MKNVILIVCISILLAACGGDSSTPKGTTPATPSNSDDNTKVGVFIDAPVQGLAYTSVPSGKKGNTNEKGEFEYIDGDTVSFNMGSIELGSATPDKTNKVKVTQLDQALLIAQLLQVLDNDVSEDRIDVSDVVIPETVKKAIVDRLKDKDGEANSEDIITEEQLVSIKKVNPKKLTLQQRVKVVPKDKVLSHIKQHIGKSGLRFTASELKNLFLIDVGLLKKFEGDNLAFSASNSIKQINVEKNQAEMSDASWELDAKGNLAISFKRDNCTISKLNEDVDSIDISWLCADKEKPKNIRKGLKYFVKPQPLSANDLSGKSFNFTSLNKESETLTFRNDGTYDCGDEANCTYKDADHKNAVWVQVGDDDPHEGALIILAQGTLAKGKFLMIHYNGENKLGSVEVIKVSGNTLKQVFEIDSDKSSHHHNNTDDHSDSNDNLNAGTQNPNYIPFTQEMISGKTLYNVYIDRDNEDKDGNKTECMPVTFSFDESSNSGEGMFGIHESITKADVTFDYRINDKGYLILSNVTFTNPEDDPDDGHNSDAIGLITNNGDSFKVCWRGSPEQMDKGCGDDNSFFYKTKEAAEAAVKEHKDNDTDENTDDNSDSNDNPNSGTQNPNYIPFTQEMISGKTFYALATYFNPKNIPIYLTTTIQFDPLNGKNTARGRSQYIYDENLSDIDTTFSYAFLKDSLILLNVSQSGSESDNVVYKLLTQTDQFLKVCSSFTNITIKDNNNCEIEFWYYDKKDAEAAQENQ